MAGDAILDFQICEISLADSVWKAQIHYRAKRFFSVFQDGGPAILDCRIHKILLADSVLRVQTHQLAIFRQNRSIGCGDIAILQIFKMADAAVLSY